MVCTLFREANKPDGSPGEMSFRRVDAGILHLAALGLFVGGLLALPALPPAVAPIAWVVFIPGALCLVVGAIMPILTTLADLKALVLAIASKKPEPVGYPARDGT